MSLLQAHNIPTPLEVRELINGVEAIRTLNAIDQVLAVRGIAMSKNEIMAMGLRVKIQLAKLNKVVPDLKSIEHEHRDPIARLTDDAIRARIGELSRALGITPAPERAEPTH